MITRRKYREIRNEYAEDPRQRVYPFPAELKIVAFRVPFFAAIIYFDRYVWNSSSAKMMYEDIRRNRLREGR